MKKLLFHIVFFFPSLLLSQTLKEFDLQEMSEQQIPVFVDHPNDAAFIFFTIINGFTVESSTGGVTSIQSEESKVMVFLKPERQILTVKAPGFIEKKLSVENLSAKQAKYYRLNGREDSYQPETGSAKITTDPAGCLLLITGFPDFRDKTPYEMKNFEARKYRINLTKPEYFPLDTLIEIRAGINQALSFKLKSKFGTLSLKAPEKVKVKINGQREQDVGPKYESIKLPIGTYTLEVNDPGFDPLKMEVTLESIEPKMFDLPLVKKSGYLQISHPEKFSFTANGVSYSKETDLQLIEFQEGTYKAVIKRSGFKQVEFSFVIKKGSVITWTPDFTPETANVSIVTLPAGADVTLIRNGKEKFLGFTPLDEMIAVGEVEFLVKKEGFNEYRIKYKLVEGTFYLNRVNLANPEELIDKKVDKKSNDKPGTLIYNGQTYPTVVIGDQEWTTVNLQTTKYNDGTPIIRITDNSMWHKTTSGAYCAYDNEYDFSGAILSISLYGYLYNWSAVNTGKLAPTGWRVPTDADWTKLTQSVGGANTAGTKLKAKRWNSGRSGTDDYGFNAFPGGKRSDDGSFDGLGGYTGWWSSTAYVSDYDSDLAWGRFMSPEGVEVSKGYSNKESGFSIRLVRDVVNGSAKNLTQPQSAPTTPQNPIQQTSISPGGKRTVSDIDGNVYHTVKIGKQEWTIENLKTTKYNDGTPITKITDQSIWNKRTSEAYCAYDNNESNVVTYGYLYNWYAVNTGKLAPKTGEWRVPTDDDWTKLTDFIGGERTSAGSLKAMVGWKSNGNGTDDYGFSALPGGDRDFIGFFNNIGEDGYWWSSSNSASYCSMGYNRPNVSRGGLDKESGYSVRLVRDL